MSDWLRFIGLVLTLGGSILRQEGDDVFEVRRWKTDSEESSDETDNDSEDDDFGHDI